MSRYETHQVNFQFCIAVSDEYKSKMARARSLIVQDLGDKPLRTIISERKKPAAMYKNLSALYATKSAGSIVKFPTELH